MSKRVLNLVREVLREQRREADYDELYYGLQDIEALLEVTNKTLQTRLPMNKRKPKRKLSAWNKFVKANANKRRFQYANGKLKLKKMGIAYRKRR